MKKSENRSMMDVPDERDSGLSPYEDIINLPHHVSARHPQMPMQDRAAQFAPFAALTGHGDAIRETAREVAESYKKRESSVSE